MVQGAGADAGSVGHRLLLLGARDPVAAAASEVGDVYVVVLEGRSELQVALVDHPVIDPQHVRWASLARAKSLLHLRGVTRHSLS